ncbi:hypothetical protein FHS15_003271 [Paenibacillus castaneae]|uniref:transposase n=1 Tax=Paenibacillus castaneae TaxID=474957 RepID=UPI000C9B13AE|nr:transposase [Paenibacillus castaneae]NIK78133.1 hypothetical protein [Paenibacillus castaneae]
MSNEDKHHEMQPITGETVEAKGVYQNEWGRQEQLEIGDKFPADPMLGSTEWELVEVYFNNHHQGHTDPRLVPHDDDNDPEAHMQHPRRHEGSNKNDDDM